jgi:hypothetical protein
LASAFDARVSSATWILASAAPLDLDFSRRHGAIKGAVATVPRDSSTILLRFAAIGTARPS